MTGRLIVDRDPTPEPTEIRPQNLPGPDSSDPWTTEQWLDHFFAPGASTGTFVVDNMDQIHDGYNVPFPNNEFRASNAPDIVMTQQQTYTCKSGTTPPPGQQPRELNVTQTLSFISDASGTIFVQVN